MSVALPKLSWWLWSGKKKDAKLQKGSSLNSELNLELDVLKFPAISGIRGGNGNSNVASNSRRIRRKWHSQDKAKVDMEHDVVLVPSDDGGCSSDYESDASDWSIGWSEPHAPDFLSEDEMDSGFGVLVPCYGRSGGKQGSRKDNSNKIAVVPELSPADNKRYMEQWLSTLHGN